MGLDTTHNCWHGSYTGFSHWRNMVAATIDWKISTDGHYGIPEDRIPDQQPMGGYPNSVYLGIWSNDPADVIDVLMVHSDCEGIIPHRFTLPLAQRLLQVADRMIEDEVDQWYIDAARDFASGLMRAHRANEDVEFH